MGRRSRAKRTAAPTAMPTTVAVESGGSASGLGVGLGVEDGTAGVAVLILIRLLGITTINELAG